MSNKKKKQKNTDGRLSKLISNYSKDEPTTVDIEFNFENEMITVKATPLLSVESATEMVQAVTEALFEGDEYIDFLYTPTLTKAILAYYTDLNIGLNNKALMKLIYQTHIMDNIIGSINQKQLQDIEKAIKDSVAFRKSKILCTHQQELERNLALIQESVNQAAEFLKLFDGFDMDQVSEIYQKLGNISEEKIIEGILASKDDTVPDSDPAPIVAK